MCLSAASALSAEAYLAWRSIIARLRERGNGTTAQGFMKISPIRLQEFARGARPRRQGRRINATGLFSGRIDLTCKPSAIVRNPGAGKDQYETAIPSVTLSGRAIALTFRMQPISGAPWQLGWTDCPDSVVKTRCRSAFILNGLILGKPLAAH